MKRPSQLLANTADTKRKHSSLRLRAVITSFAAACATVFACATDEHVVAYEEIPEAGTLPEASTPQSKPDASATTAVCGDGVVQKGELCDDGNTEGGDGCSATCVVEAKAQSCPGTEIALTAASAQKRVGSASGDTSVTGKLGLQSNTCGGGNGKDVVYSFKSDVAGRARVTIDAQFDAILSARSDCAQDSTEFSCKSVPVGGGKTEIVFPVAANQSAFIVVDGTAGHTGTFTLDIDVATTYCGDGLAQYPEQCDDGNTTAGDGCSSTCQLEELGSAPGTCPGLSYTFVGSATAPRTVSFAGDTTLLASAASAAGCSGGSGKDQAYAFTPTTSGALKVSLKASYAKSLLHIRRECFDSDTQVDCESQALASTPIEKTFPVTAQNTYFVFVDGDTSTGGLYTLDVTLLPPVCGNGVTETPEECDDGNTVAGDGCAANCALEPMPAGSDTCPGAMIALQGPPNGAQEFHTTGATTPLTGNVRTACATANVGMKDAVYAFVAPYNGYLTAKAKGDFNLVLGVRKNCLLESDAAPPSTDPNNVGCKNDDSANGAETVAAPIEAGQVYYATVKAAQTFRKVDGVFSLDLGITPSVCGNKVIEGGETCDDGAHDDGDGCSANCLLEPTPTTRTTCANAEALALDETSPGVFTATRMGGNWNLPGGGYFAAPCAGGGKEAYYTITPQMSGVVVVDVTDASYNVSIGVRPTCPPNTSTGFITCSNRSAGPGDERFSFAATAGKTYWVIVDAPGVKDLGRYKLDVTLKTESCGDGLVSGTEACDDGNLTDGDGCSKTCTLEPLLGGDQCPVTPIMLTGTGTAPRSKILTVSTTNLAADYAGTCGGNGRDAVVAVTSDITGTMTAQLTASWLTVFYARSTCGDATTELKCAKSSASSPNDVTRELSFPVQEGVPTYFFVDGLSGAYGPATLSLNVTP